ncbi:MAG: chorismate mutase [Verrucomicrobiaceae bacterium]|nr:chorismate mutase [Verrucomicrobiaceae bacterium]
MSLEDVRVKIDEIDREILRLLGERAEQVHRVGEIKRKDGLEIYAPEREEKLLRKLADINTASGSRLPEKSIRAIFREIMSAALALEMPLKIAFLGPVGSWTHQVAQGKFGHSLTYLPEPGTDAVFERVSSGAADYGVLPLEHSTEGAVHHTLDHLVDSPLQICAQVLWRAEAAHVPRSDSAPARFIVLGRRPAQQTGDDRSMLMVLARDKVGALLEVLQVFAGHGINVRQIENRPLAGDAGAEEARFFLEVNGHCAEDNLQAAIRELAGHDARVKALGSYPAPAWVEER